MSDHCYLTRRRILKTGLVSLAATAVTANPLQASKKLPGETRVLFLMGDYAHSGMMLEYHWRGVLGTTDWRLLFAQSSKYVTAEILADTDLFVLQRNERISSPNMLGWAPDRIVEDRPEPALFMTDEFENAVIENVKRGMGLVSMHNSIANAKRTKYLDLLGVAERIPHTRQQPAYIHDLNQNHPITRGIEDFTVGIDEIFNAVLRPGQTELLFKTRGNDPEIDANGGWTREVGNGHVVVLLPGHNLSVYIKKSFKEIMWRSAHWALKKDIPTSDFKDGRDY